MRVLIAEDDPILSKSMNAKLTKLGYVIDTAENGVVASQFLKAQNYELIVLDLNMPKKGGAEVLRELRCRSDKTPVLVLTARGELDDKVSLFNLGADDYLTKPFSFEELEVRARALIRRSYGLAQDTIAHGDLMVDRGACEVSVNGLPVTLTQTEYKLLDLLLTNVGKVLSKPVILDHLYQLDNAPNQSAVEIYVARLRKSLASSQSFKLRTMRGLGYILEKARET
ncbi:MAG: response regulator transcription factor [Pontibacterium sp.]